MKTTTIPMEKIWMTVDYMMADMGFGFGSAVADDIYQTIEEEFEEVLW